MAWYTIGEVAQLCDINPVTLRAWQRRYGLLKPQRTNGGHRLFNDADIDRIREIKRWVDTGVQVSKVQKLLIEGNKEQQQDWRERQDEVLRYLQSGRIERLRQWLKESTRHYPARTLVNQLITPLRQRLDSSQPTFCAMLGMLDGVLINTIALTLAASRKRAGHDALVVGWNVNDITPLWLEGWVACEQGWRVDVLAHSLVQLQPSLFPGQTLLVWCGAISAPQQRLQIQRWQEQGYAIRLCSN
ncbi:MerR family transcriptional regulator [Pseudocitrobacter cyperus]|uniref:MerR family transcriptional regulator n=1 Tax=Pseudocitrobacter cyperus TaxID=3112843 RepID=A0ABV0HLF7_9ENTR